MAATNTQQDEKDPFRGVIEDIVDTYHIMKQNEKNPPYWIAAVPAVYKMLHTKVSGLPARVLETLPKYILEDREYLQHQFFTPEMKKDHEDITKSFESLMTPQK